MSAPRRIPVTILGATGAVGQKLVSLLEGHPWFEIASLCASDRSAGRGYGEAVRWMEPGAPPPEVAGRIVEEAVPGVEGRIAFSALGGESAREIESAFAGAGYHVVTNAGAHRMDEDVPLLIPEVNPEALALLDRQRSERGWDGTLVANPNCSAVVLACALAPLERAFGVERVFVATMQAVSGAGYPGVPSLDATGNVVPFIEGEEEKIEIETRKILGSGVRVSAHANRVPVVDGHTLTVSVGLSERPDLDEVIGALTRFRPPEEVARLPSAPATFLQLHDARDRPQPRLDAGLGGGMTISIGRVRPCPLLDYRFVALGHNVVRGAAGAALLNAELLVARSIVERVE